MLRASLGCVLVGLLCLLTGCETLGFGRKEKWPTLKGLQNPQSSFQRGAPRNDGIASNSKSPFQSGIQQTNYQQLDNASQTVPQKLQLAAKAEREEDFPTAKRWLQAVLREQPTSPEAHHRLAVIADKESQFDQARQHYDMALQQDPRNPSLLSDLGYSFLLQDRLNEAEQQLTTALRIQPENQYARTNLALMYARRAQLSGSVADYQRAGQQFVMVGGEAYAQVEMQKLFPQGTPNGAPAITAPNPFRNANSPNLTAQTGQRGQELEAPPAKLNKATRDILRLMEEERQRLQQTGATEVASPGTSPFGQSRQMTVQGVPPDRLRDVMANIDQQAEWQRRQVEQQYTPGATSQQPRENQAAYGNPQVSQAAPNYSTNSPNPAMWGNPPAGGMMSAHPGSNQDILRMHAQQETHYPDSGQPQGMVNDPRSRVLSSQVPNSSEGPFVVENFDGGDPPGQMTVPQGGVQQYRGTPFSQPQQPREVMPAGAWGNSPQNPAYQQGWNGQTIGPQRPGQAPPYQGRPGAMNAPSQMVSPSDADRRQAAMMGLDAGGDWSAMSGQGNWSGNINPNGNQAPNPNGKFSSPTQVNTVWESSLEDPTYTEAPAGAWNGAMVPGSQGPMQTTDYQPGVPSFQNPGPAQGLSDTVGDTVAQPGGSVLPNRMPQNLSTPTWPNGTAGNGYQGQQMQGIGLRGQGFQPMAPPASNTGAPPMYYGR